MLFGFSQYRFKLKAQTPIGFTNGDMATTLRGAFGTALRRIMCIDEGLECVECLVRKHCVFSIVFNPARNTDKGPKRQQMPPRGFVIKAPLKSRLLYNAGETILFDLLLIGRLSDYLPYVIVPFQELGMRGIGKGRGTFSLVTIDAVKPGNSSTPVYRDDEGVVYNASPIAGAEDLIQCQPLPDQGRVILSFLTPTQIRFNPTGEKGKSRAVRKPAFFHIACRLRDRMSALCREYGPAPLDMDFKGFGVRARKIKTVDSKLKWVHDRRMSRTRHCHDLSGFVGDITFEGDFTEFWPFLVLGQYVHVGANAVFGRGWYQIETRQDATGQFAA